MAEGADEVDVTGCEREPVHIPGGIQPHGALLALARGGITIEAVSDNTLQLLGAAPRELLGRVITGVPALRAYAELFAGLGQEELEERNPFPLALDNGAKLNLVAHRSDRRLLIELEPVRIEEAFEDAHFDNRIRAAIVRLRSPTTIQELCDRTAREVRRLTGFDRVIVYRFTHTWDGEVMAEDCADGARRYLGLRFPASDIPSQARTLYATTRLRMIPTSSYTPAALLGPAGGAAVDLTRATLRAISPVHLEYMRNMGVTASMGISLMRGDRLWGLITCNHETGKRFVPYQARSACALLGDVVSSVITQREEVLASERRVAYLGTQARLLQQIGQERDVARGLTALRPSLLDTVPSIGAALLHQGQLTTVGQTPAREAVQDLLAWLEARGPTPLDTASLPGLYPAASAFLEVGCGLLAVPITFGASAVVQGRTWLLWFRPELIRTVSWGGDPRKPVTASGERLQPRTSFALWKESVHLHSARFMPSDSAAAASLAEALTDVILEVETSRRLGETAALLEAANERLRQQVEENQRVELELRRSQQLEAVGRLAAGLAHELNTPLQYVGDSLVFLEEATAELLAASSAPAAPPSSTSDLPFLREQVPLAVSRALEGLQRVSSVVTALKHFAHRDAAQKEPADLDEALRTTVELAGSELRKVADLTLQLGPLPPVRCFPGDLHRVFLALLLNAAQAIAEVLGPDRPRGHLTVRSWAEPAAVSVSVEDDGAGIPEAIRDRLFSPFFTTREVGRGAGQGLAVARAIVVERHGGTLTFESTVGRGSTFTVRLPV
jgi:light-regulated signal transduction histidine kinase (bacteriophytochrome)